MHAQQPSANPRDACPQLLPPVWHVVPHLEGTGHRRLAVVSAVGQGRGRSQESAPPVCMSACTHTCERWGSRPILDVRLVVDNDAEHPVTVATRTLMYADCCLIAISFGLQPPVLCI